VRCAIRLGVRLLGLAILAGSPACAHQPGASWDANARRLCRGPACFRVGDPGPCWRLIRVEKAAAGFRCAPLGAVIQASATCPLDETTDAAPLPSIADRLLIGFTDRVLRLDETATLAGRAAVHRVVEARLDGVPVALELWVVRRSGCLFDITLAAPPSRLGAAQPDFARFVAGFVDERPPPA
jgi:hypothetical protein